MATANTASKLNTFYGSAKLYFSRHPMVGAYFIMCSCLSVEWFRGWFNRDRLMDCIHKYRRYNIVLRPDDPAARLIKRKKIGLDD